MRFCQLESSVSVYLQFLQVAAESFSYRTSVPAHITVVTTSQARLGDRKIASRAPTATLLGGLISWWLPLQKGPDKDAFEKGTRLGRQPLFQRNRQSQLLERGRGRGRELLLLRAERIVSTATDAGQADLLR